MVKIDNKSKGHGTSRNVLRLWLCMLFLAGTTVVNAQVAKITETGMTYTDLTDAFYDASAGQTVVLLQDVDISLPSTASTSEQYCAEIPQSITFDGGNHKLTVNRRGISVAPQSNNSRAMRAPAAASNYNFDVTIKNITIENTASQSRGYGGRCIATRGKLGSLTLDGVTLTTAGSTYNNTLSPLFIGGNQATAATVTIKNSSIIADASAAKGNAITMVNPIQLNITDGSTLTAATAINFAEADESAGTNGSTVTIANSTLTSSEAAFHFYDNNITVDVTGSTINAGEGTVATFGSTTDNTVTLTGSGNVVSYTELIDAASNTGFSVAGGKYSKVVADEFLADGYICHKVVDATGKYLVEQGEYACYIGTTGYPNLKEAIACAESGDEIVLQSDIAPDGTDGTRNAFPEGMGITKSLTINGNGHTLTPVSGKRALYVEGDNIDVTLKDLNIVGNGGTTGPVWVFGNVHSLTLDHTSIDGTNYGGTYNQPLTINATSEVQLNILNGSVIKTNNEATAHYAVIAWTKIIANVQNSELKGWACFYLKGSGGNMTNGANNSNITINNCTLTSKNIYNGESNAFNMLRIEAQDVTINVTNSALNVISASDQYQAITSFSNLTGNSVTLGDGNTVTMTGENAVYAYSITTPYVSTLEVQAGTTSNVEIPEEYCADGYIPVKNQDGTYGVKTGTFIVDDTDLSAQNKNSGYESIAAAISAGATNLKLRTAAASEGVFTTDAFTIAGNVTIDLNGLKLATDDGEAITLGSGTLTFTDGSVTGAVVANGGTLAFDSSCGTNNITVTGTQSLNLTTGKFAQDIDEQYLAAHYATNLISGAYVVKATVQIATVADLQALATLCNDGSTADQTIGNTYELTANLDLSDVAWTPAGGLDSYPRTAFKGTFDGKDHTISNLTCTDTHANHATAAFFGATSSYAIIKNLTLTNVNIHSTHYAAAFVAYEGAESNYTTIENCHVNGGSIVSTPELINGKWDNGDKVGAIVGYSVRTDIKNCSVTGVTISGYRDLGGLAGFLQNAGAQIEGNTVENVTITQDNTNGYKTNNADGSLQDLSSTVGMVVGGRSGDDVKTQANDATKNTTNNVVIADPVGFLIKYDNKHYLTLQEAIDAAEADDPQSIVIDLLNDATLDISARANPLSIGTQNTETITINGNGHTLTFNKKNSDWDDVSTANDAQTKLILNNMTLTDSGYNNGPWNRYDINFSCNVELNNVTTKALAFKNAATLNNVTVTDNNDVYGIWIQTNGQDVTMNNVTVNVPNGRGIAIKDQYVNAAPAETTSLEVEDVTFTTAKKAAILVTSQYGAKIEATSLDIMNVAADSENAVWVSDDRANLYGEVTLTGDATMIPEGGVAAYNIVRKTGDKVEGYYKNDLATALAEAEDGQTIKLEDNITLAATLDIEAVGKTITLDLNEKTLSGRTNLKGGNLTITNGTVAGGAAQALNVYGSDDALAENYSVLNIADNVTVTANEFGVVLFGKTAATNGYGAVINIAGTVETTGTGAEGAVFVSGNLGKNISGGMNNIINITGTVTSTNDAAIALNGNATVNISNDAEVTGNTAIAIKRGTLNVTGGTITATGVENYEAAANNNGTEMTGAAVSMSSTYNQYGAMTVNISGGTFVSQHADALYKAEGTYANDATFAVSGGKFSSIIPAAFCADGFICETTATDGKYGVIAGEYVALIGETGYATMEDAVSAITTSPTTVKMLKDVTLAEPLNIDVVGKSVTLDLNEKTLSGRTNLKGGNLTIQNGTVAGGAAQALNVYGSDDALAENYSVLNIADNVTVTANEFGVVLFGKTAATNGYGAVINIAGTVETTGTGAEGAVFVSGNLGKNISGGMNNIINITGTVTSTNDAAIALNGNATVNISEGAAVTGNTAVAIKRGTLNVTGGTITATGDKNYEAAANNNGTEMTGAAVSMTSTYNQYGAMAVNISGGTFVSTNADALYKAEGTYANDATFAVSGGEFSSIIPDEFCVKTPTEYVCSTTKNEDGYYSIAEGHTVATIGATGYTTLQAAVDAAQDGETILLKEDIALGSSCLNINKNVNITIGGQEYCITSSAAQAVLLTGSGNVTFQNVDITASTGHGIQVGDDNTTYTGQLALNGSTLTVAKRGIRVYDENEGFGITVENSVIQSNVADPTTTYTTGNDAMGLSLGTANNNGYTVNITDSELKGFSYVINSVTSGSNLTVTMTGGKTYGRAAVNVWGSNNTFTLDGVEVHGLNNQTGPTEAFACIVDNTTAQNNTFNINNCTFYGEMSEAAYTTTGSTATEHFMDLRGTGAEVNITGQTTYSCNAPAERGGLLYDEGVLQGNKENAVALDATAMESLADELDDLTVTIVSGEADANGMYSLAFQGVAKLAYLVNGSLSGVGGYFSTIESVFSDANFGDNSWVELLADAELQSDITLNCNYFLLVQNGHSITTNGHSIVLATGKFVYCQNEAANLFTTEEARADIVKSDVSGWNVYKAAYHEVYYHWTDAESGEEDGTNCLFEDPFNKGWIADGESIDLLKDITLVQNITCNVNFTLNFGDYTLTRGEYTITLANGVTVTTDQQVANYAELFIPADATYMVVEAASGENYTYTVVTKESEGVYEFFDGTVATYALNADVPNAKVTYTRSFDGNRVGRYQAWFLPFDYTITEADMEQFTFYKINMIANSKEAGESTTDDVYIFLNTVETPGTVLKANKPYVYKPKYEVDNYEFIAEDVTLKKKEVGRVLSLSTSTDDYAFYGTYSTVSLSPSNDYRDYFMSINGDLSYPSSSTIQVGPYRWYLHMTSKNGDYARGISFVDDDTARNTTTGVKGMAAEGDSYSYFTLDGTKVSKPGKGIYIRKSADGKTRKVSFK